MKGAEDTRVVPRLRPPSLLLSAVASATLGLVACRGAPDRSGSSPDSATGISSGRVGEDHNVDSPLLGRPTAEGVIAEIDPGPYAGDDRFLGLAASFAERVTAAVERLELATGLVFHDRAAPRVLLTAMRDERVSFRLTTEVIAGRRRALLSINAEPLVSGTARPDRVLLRGLAAAAFATAPGVARVPGWFSAYVGLLASGEAADRVLALARARVRGEASPKIDADDPAAADATGLAVALLLAARSHPEDVRHWVDRVADGDDPSMSLPKLVGEGESDWVTSARHARDDAVSDADADETAERRRIAAQKALNELGPVGLSESVAALPTTRDYPAWYHADVDAIRLESAIGSGDAALAREVLLRRPPDPGTLGLLLDPGGYLLNAARVERLDRGDPQRAWELLRRFDRDFPQHPARAEAFDEMLALLGHLPPALDDRVLERVVRERGSAAIDAKSARRRIDGLLLDHRPGAAERFVASLGARGDAGDLADAREAILEAATHPSPEALEIHRRRAQSWVARPMRETENDVMDGGAPSAEALGRLIPGLSEPVRSDSVRLLVRSGGLARAVTALLPGWTNDVSRRSTDLRLLAGEVGHVDLVRTVDALDATPDDNPAIAAAWTYATFGLKLEVLAKDDLLVTRLTSPEFAIRRKAFEDLVDDESALASPALIRHMALDPATLLRRRAVLAAGRMGLIDVARRAFEAESWVVRSAAASALAEAKDDAYIPRLEAAAQGAESDVRVRAACAAALLKFADRGVARFRPIVSLMRDDDIVLADAVARALASEKSPALGRAIATELGEEALGRGARMDRGALFRLFVAYRRATGRDAGYDPSLNPAAIRALVANLPEVRAARGLYNGPR